MFVAVVALQRINSLINIEKLNRDKVFTDMCQITTFTLHLDFFFFRRRFPSAETMKTLRLRSVPLKKLISLLSPRLTDVTPENAPFRSRKKPPLCVSLRVLRHMPRYDLRRGVFIIAGQSSFTSAGNACARGLTFDEEAERVHYSFISVFIKRSYDLSIEKNFCRSNMPRMIHGKIFSDNFGSFNYVIGRSVVHTDDICTPHFLSILPHSLHYIENLIYQVAIVIRFQ